MKNIWKMKLSLVKVCFLCLFDDIFVEFLSFHGTKLRSTLKNSLFKHVHLSFCIFLGDIFWQILLNKCFSIHRYSPLASPLIRCADTSVLNLEADYLKVSVPTYSTLVWTFAFQILMLCWLNITLRHGECNMWIYLMSWSVCVDPFIFNCPDFSIAFVLWTHRVRRWNEVWLFHHSGSSSIVIVSVTVALDSFHFNSHYDNGAIKATFNLRDEVTQIFFKRRWKPKYIFINNLNNRSDYKSNSNSSGEMGRVSSSSRCATAQGSK